MENLGSSLQGIYCDLLRDRHHRVIYDSGWVSNTVVYHCRVLLAGLMVNRQITGDKAPASETQNYRGILYLEVGQGLEAWDDDERLREVPESTTGLTAPAEDAPIPLLESDFIYLKEGDVPSSVPTNRLQITATLGSGYPVPIENDYYPLREFGLFGRFDNQLYMVNCVRHPLIQKQESAALTRVIRLYF